VPIKFQKLSYAMIEDSSEIAEWLTQFDKPMQNTAISLLSHLRFVKRDEYSNWILGKLESNKFDKCALYAVRKLENENLWHNITGEVLDRPAVSQGSEDFIYSLMSNITRLNSLKLFDTPSLNILREQKIRDIILIDDSIGSGERVKTFIQSMMANKTFKSWWSYGLVRIYIFSLVRTVESEKYIVQNIPGSDHGIRKYRKSDKIRFESEIVYRREDLSNRWGSEYQDILSLCGSITQIPSFLQKGWGGVMGNIIFYHSIPDNIPGILYFSENGWKPLFLRACVPEWLRLLLNNHVKKTKIKRYDSKIKITEDIMQILLLIKKGVRNKSSLALRMDYDSVVINGILKKILIAGFVSDKLRLTKTGLNILKQKIQKRKVMKYNYDLYIPQKWCAD
jgi:hypothetical protein